MEGTIGKSLILGALRRKAWPSSSTLGNDDRRDATSKKVELQRNKRISHLPNSIAIMAAGLNAISRWAVPVFLTVALGQAAIYDVKGGTRAVIFDRLSGVQEQVVNEGTHFLIPWLQKSIIYDVRTKPRNISTTTGSKDLQMVSLTLRVLHRPEVQKLPKIYQVCLHLVPPLIPSIRY